MELDKEIIGKLLDFLLKKKEHEKEEKGIYEGLVWLKDFLGMFEEDFL
jgi:hypothetical protein